MNKSRLLVFILLIVCSLSLFGCTGMFCKHDWKIISDTSTCEQAGKIKKECLKCGKVKEEKAKAKEHSYDSKGYCTKCKNFIYHIALGSNATGTYGNLQGETIKINKIEKILKDNKVYLLIRGTKSYDPFGNQNKSSIRFGVKLTDGSGNRICDKQVATKPIVTSEAFGTDGYYELELIDASELSKDKYYYINITDLSKDNFPAI